MSEELLRSAARGKYVPLTANLVCRCSLSALVGLVLGVAVSLVVNCTLVEISLSAFFSMYFGLVFVVVGGAIIWRVSKQDDDGSSLRKQLIFFATMIIISGVICFMLERHLFVHMSALSKIPLYVLLGVSVSFALVFSIVDFVNFIGGFMQNEHTKPVVESKAQVYLILLVSVIMGSVFGLVFGVLDVEDELQFHIRLSLIREEHYCYPVGAILGLMAGAGNELLRETSKMGVGKLKAHFDDDI
eukprot:GHVR01165412.1.p1 GENE.GHVR01165412.1~~GHVR01165412.1.p1  ORF type:complete len:244 (-),score=44.79 GHVR01165412.1:245-976(-)